MPQYSIYPLVFFSLCACIVETHYDVYACIVTVYHDEYECFHYPFTNGIICKHFNMSSYDLLACHL